MEQPITTKNVGQPCVICGQAADAQATIAALQGKVLELRKVIERVAHHKPIMGSRGEYRQGQIDVLESVRRIAQEELYGSHQITG